MLDMSGRNCVLLLTYFLKCIELHLKNPVGTDHSIINLSLSLKKMNNSLMIFFPLINLLPGSFHSPQPPKFLSLSQQINKQINNLKNTNKILNKTKSTKIKQMHNMHTHTQHIMPFLLCWPTTPGSIQGLSWSVTNVPNVINLREGFF